MANLALVLSVIFCAGVTLCNAKCGQVFEYKVTEADRATIVGTHNHLRSLISQGMVPGQPKGINLKTIQWDPKLAKEAQKIANSCEFRHVNVFDGRFFNVGQNLGWSGYTVKTPGADWRATIQMWFDEHKDFRYPSTSSGVTGHYTQVVWADTYLIGCGYTMYRKDNFQYEKLYVCNYGPGGNWVGQPPYKTQ